MTDDVTGVVKGVVALRAEIQAKKEAMDALREDIIVQEKLLDNIVDTLIGNVPAPVDAPVEGQVTRIISR